MVYLFNLLLIFSFCCSYAAVLHDSVMIDTLSKYIEISDVRLDDLYDQSSTIEYDETKLLSLLSFDRPLFQFFPGLIHNVPCIKLGDLPTPVEKLQNVGEILGCEQMYIKRDDDTGQKNRDESDRFFGGNKIRKLEYLLAEALSFGCKTVMTKGGAGSNHALATTVCSHILGLRSVSILGPQERNDVVKRNLLLGKFYGADLCYFNDWRDCSSGIVDLFSKIKKAEGAFPYYITVGGSCPLGAVGFVSAAFELKLQIEQGVMPEPDFIYVACGSMGTAAGLILGLKAAGLKSKVVAVKVGSSTRISKIIDLAKETNALLHQKDPKFPVFNLNERDFIFEEGFLGEGYAQQTEEATGAAELMKVYEGIQLDGTYSGKAFAAVVSHVRNNELQDKAVLFWDTFCGYSYDDIVSTVDHKTLPPDLHGYFS